MGGEPLKGALRCGGVVSLVVDLTQPDGKGAIEFQKGVSFEAGEEFRSHGTEEAFDLAFSLRLIGPRMYQGNTETCGDVLKMMRPEDSAVVGVKFSWQSSGQQSVL